MAMFTAEQLADHYILLEAEEITYKDLTSSTPSFTTGIKVDVFDDSTITVLREAEIDAPDNTRAMLEADRAYTCLAGADVDVGDTTIYGLGVTPEQGDQVEDGSNIYAVTAWRFLNDNLQVRLFCRLLP